jgi:mannose-6-phosphate isomerase
LNVSAICLAGRHVERVWGRRALPAPFAGPAAAAEPIGEIWFEDSRGSQAELLVKALFTSDRLSIQVHPDDEAARAAGLARGKDEAWYILSAEPGAVIGLGLKAPVSSETLRAAALDGSIEALIDWRPVAAGDVFYSPGGTIHAIGPGLSLIEVQQNLDLTYRLYDYGRPRELHLDEALAVADAGPWSAGATPYLLSPGREILAEGGAFVLERWTVAGAATIDPDGREMLIVPIAAGGRLDGRELAPGSAWSVVGASTLDAGPGVDLLVAYAGGAVNRAALTTA